MYNFKELEPLAESDIEYPKSEPYKLCTFSRVMKEKGIEDAINAVESVNAHFGRTVYTLDIFGQIDVEYKERFSQLEKSFPDYISYGGAIEANKSVETLKSYLLCCSRPIIKARALPERLSMPCQPECR